jgi:membrane protease YdiL (CAAX protease family)
VWAPARPAGTPPAWIALAPALGIGLSAGFLDWRALAAFLVFGVAAVSAAGMRLPWPRRILMALTGVFALLLALHRIPGFHNPVIAHAVRLAPDALPFSLRANFDTALVGIVLMLAFCDPIRTRAGWAAMLRRTWPVALATMASVLALGWASGYVRPDVKWTPYSAAFLFLNLLFTCVAEEAFFRGLILAGLARALSASRCGAPVAAAVSALLFGLAHAGGGPVLVVLATVAGAGYAAAYLRSGRIEGAILTHFLLNAVHFVAFTYPALAR